MRRVGLVMVVLLAACAGGEATVTSVAAITTTVGSAATSSTSAAQRQTCPESLDFVSEGRVLRVDQPDSDATSIGLIDWAASEGCERIEISFETLEGAPATTPPNVVVRFIDTLQILRIDVGAGDSIIVDQIIDSAMVERLYVVRQLQEGNYIDLHLKSPVMAKARVTGSPAKLIIDLQPGPQGFLGHAAVAPNAVMVTPSDGAVETKNLEVSGYVMSSTGEVTVIATSEGQVVAEARVPVTGDQGRWSEFRTRLDVRTGETTVFAGEPDPGDGGLEGVTVGIEVR